MEARQQHLEAEGGEAGSPPQTCAFMRRSTKKHSDVPLAFTVVVSALSDMFFVHRACASHISRFHVALMVFVQPWYLGCISRNRGSLQTTCTNVPSLPSLESFVRTPFVGRARSSSRA